MAIRIDAAGDDLARTTNLPSITSFTIMCWGKISVDTNGFAAFLTFGQNSGGFSYYHTGTGSDGTIFASYNDASVATGPQLTVGKWYHFAISCGGTGANQFLSYLDGALTLTQNGDADPTAQEITIGASADGNQSNACFAAVKVYSAVLSEAEIATEMRYYRPQRLVSLNSWHPLIHPVVASNGVDYSGNSNAFTMNGTLAVEDGPPIAWGPRARRYFILAAAPLTGPPIGSLALLGVGR